MNMKTPMEIFKKHGAHYYENDEQSIIDAMNEYTEQQVKNLNIPAVINQVCDHKYEQLSYYKNTILKCKNCGKLEVD